VHPNLPSTNTTTFSDCRTLSGQVPGIELKQWLDGYGAKDSEKEGFKMRVDSVMRHINN